MLHDRDKEDIPNFVVRSRNLPRVFRDFDEVNHAQLGVFVRNQVKADRNRLDFQTEVCEVWLRTRIRSKA
jgi:hypothetical protein